MAQQSSFWICEKCAWGNRISHNICTKCGHVYTMAEPSTSNVRSDQTVTDVILTKATSAAQSIKRSNVPIYAAGAVVAVGLATVALPVIGFTSGGVAAGSIAAGVQSSIGSVAAGSGFAMLQSAGAAGYATSTQVIIGGIGAGGAGALFARSKDELNDGGIARNPPNRS